MFTFSVVCSAGLSGPCRMIWRRTGILRARLFCCDRRPALFASSWYSAHPLTIDERDYQCVSLCGRCARSRWCRALWTLRFGVVFVCCSCNVPRGRGARATTASLCCRHVCACAMIPVCTVVCPVAAVICKLRRCRDFCTVILETRVGCVSCKCWPCAEPACVEWSSAIVDHRGSD